MGAQVEWEGLIVCTLYDIYTTPIYTGDVDSTSTKANVHEAYPEEK